MASRMVELRDAVAASLTGAPLPYAYDVYTNNISLVRLEETNRTRVYVNPGTKTYSIDTRGDYQEEHEILVHVTNFLDTNSQLEEDNAMELVESIEDWLVNQTMANMAFLRYRRDTQPEPLFVSEEMTNYNFFHSMISAFYLYL